MKRLFVLLLFIAVAVIGLFLAMLNPYDVVLNYYSGEVKLPFAVVLVFTLAIGALIGMFSNLMMMLSRRSEVRKLRRRIRLQEEEIHNLRDIPIRDLH